MTFPELAHHEHSFRIYLDWRATLGLAVPVPKGVTRILNLPRGYSIIEWYEGDMFLLEDPLFNFVSCTGQLRHDNVRSPETVKRRAKGSRRR